MHSILPLRISRFPLVGTLIEEIKPVFTEKNELGCTVESNVKAFFPVFSDYQECDTGTKKQVRILVYQNLKIFDRGVAEKEQTSSCWFESRDKSKLKALLGILGLPDFYWTEVIP